MLALGSVQEVVERQIRTGNVNFDMAGFMQNVVLADIANPGENTSPQPCFANAKISKP